MKDEKNEKQKDNKHLLIPIINKLILIITPIMVIIGIIFKSLEKIRILILIIVIIIIILKISLVIHLIIESGNDKE